MRALALLAIVVCALVRATPTPAEPPPRDALEEGLAAARRGAVARLEVVATWCNDQRIAGTRDRVFERILTLDPDHARARAGLKYARADRNAPWVRKAPYVAPVDWNKGSVAEGERRLAEALAGYRDAVLAAVAPDTVPAGRREALLDGLVDLLPDDEAVRTRHGDVAIRGRWMLAESAEAVERRARWTALADERRREAPGPTEEPKGRADGWGVSLAFHGVRARATVKAAETRGVLVDAWAVRSVTLDALGVATPAKEPGLTEVVLVKDHAEGLAAVRNLERDPADALRRAELVSGLWLTGEVFLAQWSDPALRRTGTLRQVVDTELDLRFPAGRPGWATEGMGQRLLFLATGVHGPPLVTIEGTDLPTSGDDDAPLPDDARAWLPRAARLLERDGDRRIAEVLTARLNAMRPGLVLVAYALSAYLLEGRPEALAAFVQASNGTPDAAKVVADVFQVDPAALAVRVRRFALEAR